MPARKPKPQVAAIARDAPAFAWEKTGTFVGPRIPGGASQRKMPMSTPARSENVVAWTSCIFIHPVNWRIDNMRSNMKNRYSRTIQPRLWLVGMLAFCAFGSALAQNKAIDFKKGMPFSDGY